MPFETILFNQRIAVFLKNAIEKDRLHHCLLFEGPDGIGKMEMAIETAKALNCTGKDIFGPCSCPSCQKIPILAFSDLKILEPDGQFIKVEAVRNMVREIYFSPFEGKKRVYIFKKAEAMNAESANTILKSLEEPPPHVQFILITAHPHLLLPTIRSRSQQVTFHALGVDEIVKRLAESETEDRNRLRGMLSGGSLQKAADLDLEEYGRRSRAALELLGILSETGLEASHLLAPEGTLDLKEEMEPVLTCFFLILRDALILSLGGAQTHVIHTEFLAELSRSAQRLKSQRILNAMAEVNSAIRSLRYNINRRIAYDALLIRLDEIGRES
jgi:DNA polymerase-3 subunit delta'